MASRRTFGYEEWWRRVLRPEVSERYVMRRDDGTPIFDFLVETDALGLRRSRPQEPPAPDHEGQRRRVVACIGDSMTMGWGVDAEDSYPEQLQAMLGPRDLVLNVGQFGFGLMAAIEKFRRVDAVHRADVVLWIPVSNDLEEDPIFLAHARRSGFRHALGRATHFAQRHSHLFNVVPALIWSTRFRGRVQLAEAEDRGAFGASLSHEEWLAAAAAALAADHPTARALLDFSAACAAEGRDFRVVFTQSDPESLQLGRLCLDRGIPFLAAPVPWEGRIRNDWHFNPEGCRAVAGVVAEAIRRPD